MATVDHIKFIPEVKELTENWRNEVPSVLKYSKLRKYDDNIVAYHIDKPGKTYKIEYMLTAGDVNDLSIRYHRMFITHQLAFNQFEQMDWSRNGIDTQIDSSETFRKKLKSVVILSDIQLINERKYNEQTQNYDIIPRNKTVYYLVPYDIFRQFMFVKELPKRR